MKYFTLIFALAIGVVAIWMSQKLVRLYFTVRSWDKVRAKVLSKEIVVNEKSSDVEQPYRLKVEYSYQYKDVDYKGNKIDLVELMGGSRNYRKAEGEKRVAKFDDEITIYINPDNPTQSVMSRDGIILYFFIFIMGLFSIILGFSEVF